MPDSSRLLLPEGARLLHIGPYKTGSTMIQYALHHRRTELAEHGVVYAGEGSRPRRAGWAVLSGGPRGRNTGSMEDWHQLVSSVREAADKRVCVSNEDFQRANLDQVARIVDELGGEHVHVVSIARRLDKVLPSQWQQRLQSFFTVTYEEYLEHVLGENQTSSTVNRAFWASHHVQHAVERWTSVVGADHFSLITSDDADRGLLPRTFEQMLGLPAGLLTIEAPRNPSLAMNGAELLRRMNETFTEREWPDEVYQYMMRQGAARSMKHAPRTSLDDPIPSLPNWAVEKVVELSEARVEAIMSMEIQVIGDPRGLLVDAPDPDQPAFTTPEVISIESAAQALQGAVDGALQLQAKYQRQYKQKLRERDRTLREREQALRRLRQRQPAHGRPVERTSSRTLLAVVRQRLVKRLLRLGRRS